MIGPTWQVQILAGDKDVDITQAPVLVGPATVTLGDFNGRDLGEAKYHLLYGPVHLRSVGRELFIEKALDPEPIDGMAGFSLPRQIIRTMDHLLYVEITDWDDIQITGYET